MVARGPLLRCFLRPQTARQSAAAGPLSRRHIRQLQPPIRDINVRSTKRNGEQWIRYSTPYSLSSIRTFARSRSLQNPEGGSGIPHSDPAAAQKIDAVIEEIQDLYGTARDEFEIAAEETEKNTTYAPDDRIAAREEVDKLLAYYNEIIEGNDRAVAEEVKNRVGQRIRELEQAMIGLEEAAQNHD